MSKNEFICDCNVIHQELVKEMIKKIPSEPTFHYLAKFFKILGNNTRSKILFILDQKEMCVCDLANVLNMSKSSVSHQLGAPEKKPCCKVS